MNEQETISDIIRKIRAEADLIEESARGSLKAGETLGGMPFTESDLESALDLAETKRKEADRLEVALGREREASGNTAALHEALKPVKRYLDGYTVNILELRRTVDAALSAPARNCDRFASAEEAWNAYDEWVESYRAKGKIPPFNEFGWLFAPATEQEGSAK